MQILFEDNHLLVVNKPAGWIVQGVQPGQSSLLEWGKRYIKNKYRKPGNVFLGVVSRLDAPVTGVVALARTSKGASRLSEQIRNRTFQKVYWAIIDGRLIQPSGRLEHWLIRDESRGVTEVTRASQSSAKNAALEYRHIKSVELGELVEIHLITGRKHQIRAQFSAIGCPILGDRKYDSPSTFPEGIALHCRSIAFRHPTRGDVIQIAADPPDSWRI